MQSSKHHKAYPDEEDSVLLSESLKFSSKEMAMHQDEGVSMGGECSQVYREDGYNWGENGRRTGGFGLSPSRILISGNGKERRRKNIPGRGNY